ncbi:hypothetical protein [Azohydromonas lata]|uniref:hypothetical protein n=1 Tax=Azohydromonas lata TaxID=45677 RepID=UPI0012F48EEE|nr:hypothetical protein [Azohydromonas lata]
MANIPKWSDNTREERYFTAVLFGALVLEPEPFWALLRPHLGIAESVKVKDIGYEVCMLRDLAHKKFINRYTPLEKQTFDLVFTLSNDALVLIEAKAHQCFSLNQIENMVKAKSILLESEKLGISQVHLAGIHSARYNPINVRTNFKEMALVTWAQLATAYPALSNQLQRADEIYAN